MMQRNPISKRSLLSASIASALTLCSFNVLAQQSSNDEETALDVIVVTATRRAEDPQKIPVAVSALADEKLDVLTSGGDDVRILSARLPSLQVESSFGRTFPRFYVRGLGNTDFDLNASQPVSLVYDDIVQENPVLKGFPMFDLEQVELIRGPQGTLFGRNTPAGVVKFDSRRPTEVQEGYGKISYGSFSNVNAEGAISGGFADGVSARLSALYQRRDDYVDNTFRQQKDAFEGYREYAVRGQLQYAPDDSFSALLNVHARDLVGTARLFRANIIQPGTNNFVSTFDRDRVAIDGRNQQDASSAGASLRLRFGFDGFSLNSITGYETVDYFSRGDIDGGFGAAFAPPSGPGVIPFPAESADGVPDHGQFSQEFRLESDDDSALNWQTGFFYFDENLTIDSFNFNTLAGGVQNGYAQQKQDNKAYAVFGSLDYDVSDAMNVRAGLRYTDDEKDFSAFRTASPIGGGPIPRLTANLDDSDVSWDLAGVYSIDDNTRVFARVARGFRAPSVQGRILFGNSLSVAQSESVTSVEAGLKNESEDRRTRFNLTAFRYEVKDQQLTAVGGQANFNQLINAKKSTGQGIEADMESYLTPDFLVTASASYNDTEIKDPNLFIQPCGARCTVLDPAGRVPGTVSINGNSLPNAPKVIGNITARYSVPMGNGEMFFYTDWAYRSKVSFFLYESREFTGKSLVEGGLRVGYLWNAGDQELALFGRNILDKEVIVGGIDFNNLTGFINEPRILGLEYRVRF